MGGGDRKVGPVSSEEEKGSDPLKKPGGKSRGDVGGAQEGRHGKARHQSECMYRKHEILVHFIFRIIFSMKMQY